MSLSECDKGGCWPTTGARAAHAARPGRERERVRGSPVNLASRSGVPDKLSVTAEMSTTKCSDPVLEMGWGSIKRGERTSVNKNGRGERKTSGPVSVSVTTGLLLYVNGSVEKGGFEQQNKLMEAQGT